MTTLPLPVAKHTRRQAFVRSHHYSTCIVGNRFTPNETEQGVHQSNHIPHRAHNVYEMRYYYRALQKIKTWAEQQTSIAEDLIHRL